MSWDAIIAKTSGTNFAKPSENAAFVGMGTAVEVRSKLDAAVPAIRWESASEGHALIGKLSLEFSLTGTEGRSTTAAPARPMKESDEVESIGVSARGAGDPISIIVGIAKLNRWSIADSQDGTWIDLNAASQKSWKEFTAYRAKLDQSSPEPNSTDSGSIRTNLLISVALLVVIVILLKRFSK